MSKKRKILAIVNPIAGRGHGVRLEPAFARLADETHTSVNVVLTDYAGHATTLAAEAVARGIDGIAVCGGDGTVREVLNGVGFSRTPLMLVRGGTGNVLAREVGASSDPLQYRDALRDWCVSARDLGRTTNGELFGCFLGAGVDAECARVFREKRKGNIRIWQYVPTAWSTARSYGIRPFELRFGENTRSVGIGYALVAISAGYGGPINLVPHAIPDDGQFDILSMISPVEVHQVAQTAILGMFKATRLLRTISFDKASQVCLTPANIAEAPVPYQLDGDFMGHLPIEVEILPRVMQILRPTRGGLPPQMKGR